jgi:hypothetical protein
MPQDQVAGVVPFQPWSVSGHAEVAPLPPSPATPCIVPLEHHSGSFDVDQKEYFAGLVVVPEETPDQPLDTIPTTLPLELTSEKKIKVNVGQNTAAPNGVVVLFSSKK